LAFSKRVGMSPSEFVRQHCVPSAKPMRAASRADEPVA
jgi:hypothetical protein